MEADNSLTAIDWLPNLSINMLTASMEGGFLPTFDSFYSIYEEEYQADHRSQFIHNTGEGKPSFSYANLITNAINSSKMKRMTLCEIYRWICRNYPYYCETGEGWKSLNEVEIAPKQIQHQNDNQEALVNNGEQQSYTDYWQSPILNNLERASIASTNVDGVGEPLVSLTETSNFTPRLGFKNEDSVESEFDPCFPFPASTQPSSTSPGSEVNLVLKEEENESKIGQLRHKNSDLIHDTSPNNGEIGKIECQTGIATQVDSPDSEGIGTVTSPYTEMTADHSSDGVPSRTGVDRKNLRSMDSSRVTRRKTSGQQSTMTMNDYGFYDPPNNQLSSSSITYTNEIHVPSSSAMTCDYTRIPNVQGMGNFSNVPSSYCFYTTTQPPYLSSTHFIANTTTDCIPQLVGPAPFLYQPTLMSLDASVDFMDYGAINYPPFGQTNKFLTATPVSSLSTTIDGATVVHPSSFVGIEPVISHHHQPSTIGMPFVYNDPGIFVEPIMLNNGNQHHTNEIKSKSTTDQLSQRHESLFTTDSTTENNWESMI